VTLCQDFELRLRLSTAGDSPTIAPVNWRGNQRNATVCVDPSAFDYDRWRGNLLLLAGKQVLRFTASQLDDPVGFIEVVRRARARHGV
jgi:hypothetical protein